MDPLFPPLCFVFLETFVRFRYFPFYYKCIRDMRSTISIKGVRLPTCQDYDDMYILPQFVHLLNVIYSLGTKSDKFTLEFLFVPFVLSY